MKRLRVVGKRRPVLARSRPTLLAALIVAAIVGYSAPESPISESYAGPSSTFYGSSCTGPHFCVAVGSAVAFSRTGGRSWRVESLPRATWIRGRPATLTSVSCFARRYCVAVGYSGLMLYSPNRAKTWTRVGRTLQARYLAAITCLRNGFCLVAGRARSGAAIIASSGDSGRRWRSSRWPFGGFQATAVTCSSVRSCFLAGAHGHKGVLLASHDGGRSWVRSFESRRVPDFISMSCSSARVCLAVDSASKKVGAITSDAGRSWRLVARPRHLWPRAVFCVAGAVCVVAGVSGSGTADIVVGPGSRRAWEITRVPRGSGSLYAVSCLRPLACVSAGEGRSPGSLFWTHDGLVWHKGMLLEGTVRTGRSTE